MNRATRMIALMCSLAVTAFALYFAGSPPNGRSSTAGITQGSSADAGEAAEMRVGTRARLRALSRADTAGLSAVDDTGARVPIPGWADEKLFSTENDWEPAAAADPSSGYVYMLTTQYGGPKACPACNGPAIRMRTSTDGGHSFGPETFLCPCPASFQADPQIEVDADGDVYAAWLTNPFGAVFSRSTDHGVTWTPPVQVLPHTPAIPWNDHPWLAVSPSGEDVYIGTNQEDNYQVSSHDFGATWSAPVKTDTDGKYYFAEGATVLPDGDVVFSSSAFGCCRYNQVAHKRPVDMHIFRSEDGGATWTDQLIDTSKAPPLCTTYACPLAQYGAQMSIASDAHGNILVAYNLAKRPHGGQRIYVRTSSDHGVTFSERTAISPAIGTNGGVNAIYPQVAGQGDKHFAVTWADNRFGKNRYQTWERDSFDAGLHFTEAVQISNMPGGAKYKHPAGYQFNYGDYFDIVINNVGEAFVVWGESVNYWGPGNTWWNVQNTP